MREVKVFPLVRPDVPHFKKWRSSLPSIYRSNHFSNAGNTWKKLNSELERYFPDRSVVAIGNNTIGQISVLDALQIRGKKVVVSNYTFAATIQAVIHAGGIPVLVDVETDSGEIEIASIENAIKEHGEIALVLYTRIFGQRRSTEDLESYLELMGIPLVIDAAAGFPTKPTKKSSAIEVFSFHATKAFSVGEGGAISGPSELLDLIWKSCNFGIQNTEVFTDGINSKMDEFTAARALAMLNSFPEVARRRQNFVDIVYKDFEVSHKIQTLKNDGSWAWSLFPIKFLSREKMEHFASLTSKAGLSGKNYYFPSMYQGYQGSANVLKNTVLANSDAWANNTYCLPVYAKYTSKELKIIRHIVKSSIQEIE